VSSLLSREPWTRPYAWPFLALFALNLLLFLAFTLPRSIQERRAAARVLQLRDQLENRRKEVASVRTMAETVRSNVTDTKRFYTEQVKECVGISGPLLQELRALGRELGVRADRLGTSSPKTIEGADLAEIDVIMPLTGSYQQSASFLQRLERSPQFLVVDSIAMREATRAEAGGTDLDMRIKAFCHTERRRRQ
jgi:Tfp pilus assembly protein PilO